ncbi:MAG TPA: hypothetical protein VGY52_11170 [Roseiarcus sp.]|jgi:hypothetical protein|nr:hypothetical protein [Roseiarcus sp.]
MSSGSAPKSGRDIVAYFAGHLANLVNGNDSLSEAEENVVIKPFSLFEKVHRTLVANRKYSEVLVGVWAYPPPNTVEDAADFYFDHVIDRPIGSRGEGPSSADNLANLIGSRAVGPSPPRPQVPLSIWKALVGGATTLKRFVEQKDLFELSNRILKCLDAANRPYAEVLRLGLCPKEWLVGDDAVGVNTLKAANAFLKALKSEMKGVFGRRPTPAELEAAFKTAPVPGYKEAKSFAATLLGSAILTRVAGQDETFLTSFEAVEQTLGEQLEAESDEPLMDAEEAAPFLEIAVSAGAIEAEEKRLLVAIMAGRSLAEVMGSNLYLRRRLKTDFGNDLEAYINDLSSRTARFISAAGRARP